MSDSASGIVFLVVVVLLVGVVGALRLLVRFLDWLDEEGPLSHVNTDFLP